MISCRDAWSPWGSMLGPQDIMSGSFWGAWEQLGTTWDDMLSPKGSPKRPQRDRRLRQHVFYEGQVQNRPNGCRVARATSTLTAFLRVVKKGGPTCGWFHVLEGGGKGVYI